MMDGETLRRWQEAVSRAQKALENGDTDDPEKLRGLVQKLSGVEGALRKISKGSVSRRTLSDAVRESLETILADEKSKYFPEMAELAGVLDASEEKMQAVRRELANSLTNLELELSSKVESLAAGVAARLDERLQKIERRLETLSASMGGELLDQMEYEKLASLLEEKLTQRLDNIGARLAAVASPHESGLERQEIGGQLDTVEDRLGRLTAEIATLTEGILSLRQIVSTDRVRPEDIQSLLDRRQTDASLLLQKSLLDLRDTLREELKRAEEKSRRLKPSFWQNLRGRPHGGLVLTEAEWESLRARLESAVARLESFLSQPPPIPDRPDKE